VTCRTGRNVFATFLPLRQSLRVVSGQRRKAAAKGFAYLYLAWRRPGNNSVGAKVGRERWALYTSDKEQYNADIDSLAPIADTIFQNK
jgi:hypothetical protein